jgi:uncharacterized protein (TIGR02302 family)
MTEVDPHAGEPAAQRVFARKVRLSTWALFFERLWPRLWILIGLTAVFAGLSFAGVWPALPPIVHQVAVGLFGLAGLAALIYAGRAEWPARDEAVRRLERRSGIPHRPASSYEDQLTAQVANPETAVLWQAHRERLKRMIERLKVGRPSPRADRYDPFALRTLSVLVLIVAAVLVTGSWSDRLASAFRFARGDATAGQRVDAWVSPPPYTAIPPMLLADGSESTAQSADRSKFYEVPERSLLTLRGTGFEQTGLTLEVLSDGASQPEKVSSEKAKPDGSSSAAASGLTEVRYTLTRSARVRAMSGSSELAHWTFSIIPDQLPKITLDTKRLDATPRGSMRLSYNGEDDYGIASAEAKVRQIKDKKGAPDPKAWAKAPPLKGPRLPLERPPVLALKIPHPGEKTLKSSTLLELGSHPWAGQRVELWLEAIDVGGQIGRSQSIEIVLPARQFKKPLARSLIELRRKLSEDSRNRSWVTRALTSLTMEPQGFIPSTGIYLALRGIDYRLERSGSRGAINESIAELWDVALAVEDGELSEAERALKDAQDRLAEALRRGADDQEINQLLAELRQKLNDYLEEMRKQAQNNGGDQNQQQDDQQQQLGSQDLDQMMKDLERSAKQGSREEAEQMLSQLRELMDRLQAETKESREANQRAKEMMNKLNLLDELADKQRQLMDDTFNAQRSQQGAMQGGRQPGDRSQNGQQGQNGQGEQQGQNGMQPDQNGGGQMGQGQQGREGRGPGQRQMGEEDLRQRQADLRRKLNELKKDLEKMGAGDRDKLGNAEDAMGQAEQALEGKDYQEAAEQQGEALEQMRQAAKQMAQQMQKNAQQRLGRGGDSPRDPLGRPQRAEGPDLGTSVKVPDEIDAQRAREILEELRKRSGENLRPPVELDYIDRLLKRF